MITAQDINQAVKNISNKERNHSLFDRLFNRWTKWELHKQDLPYIEQTYASPIIGSYPIGKPKSVLVDIYVKTNKFNGLKKYKQVVKYH